MGPNECTVRPRQVAWSAICFVGEIYDIFLQRHETMLRYKVSLFSLSYPLEIGTD